MLVWLACLPCLLQGIYFRYLMKECIVSGGQSIDCIDCFLAFPLFRMPSFSFFLPILLGLVIWFVVHFSEST